MYGLYKQFKYFLLEVNTNPTCFYGQPRVMKGINTVISVTFETISRDLSVSFFSIV